MSRGLAAVLFARAGDHGGVRVPDWYATWAELERAVRERAAALGDVRGREIVVHGASPLGIVTCLAALDAAGATAILAGARGDPVPGRFDGRLDADAAPGDGAATAPGGSEAHVVAVLSSGTTGRPHLERWRWTSLVGGLRIPDGLRGGRWVSHYPLDTFAGLQGLLSGCVAADELVLAGPSDSLGEAVGDGARVVMATPTIWRRALVLEDGLAGRRIEVASMGGEPAEQPLLDRLAAALPGTRVVHVYASSELGSVFSVADGRAGFPAAWLGARRPSGVEPTVRDGILWISRAPGAPAVSTGDAVRIDGDRVLFLGRGERIINVGGRKVDRDRVTRVLMDAPGVADARAYGVDARLTGQLVAADVVLAPGAALETVHAHCRDRLEPHERPRRIRVVDAPEAGPAGKAVPA